MGTDHHSSAALSIIQRPYDHHSQLSAGGSFFLVDDTLIRAGAGQFDSYTNIDSQYGVSDNHGRPFELSTMVLPVAQISCIAAWGIVVHDADLRHYVWGADPE